MKGQKDRVDIVCLATSGKVDWKHYRQLVKKFGVEEYEKRLLEIVRSAKVEFEYLGMKNLREVKKIKDRIIKEFSLD